MQGLAVLLSSERYATNSPIGMQHDDEFIVIVTFNYILLLIVSLMPDGNTVKSWKHLPCYQSLDWFFCS